MFTVPDTRAEIVPAATTVYTMTTRETTELWLLLQMSDEICVIDDEWEKKIE